MPIKKSYIGAIGVIIDLDCEQDISTASVTKMKVKKPDGTVVTWNASVVTLNGNSNYLRYTTIADDLNLAGTYEIQAYVEMGSKKVYGTTAQLEIYDLFD